MAIIEVNMPARDRADLSHLLAVEIASMRIMSARLGECPEARYLDVMAEWAAEVQAAAEALTPRLILTGEQAGTLRAFMDGEADKNRRMFEYHLRADAMEAAEEAEKRHQRARRIADAVDRTIYAGGPGPYGPRR